MRLTFTALLFCLLSSITCASPYDTILPLRERAAKIDAITQQRINTLLPAMMKETGIDMWLLISSEYNEDPVMKTLLPATWMSARRTTMLALVLDENSQVGAYAIAPYKVGDIFEKAWNKELHPDQWEALADFISQHNPERIGINQSAIWAHADGLVASHKEQLLATLPEKYAKRVSPAESLAVRWLETRTPEEVKLMTSMGKIAHEIIREGFSSRVIKPGTTTTEDLVWWFREKVDSLHLDTWFHPSVSLQRSDEEQFDHEDSFTNDLASIIMPGDLLHVDFGITYLRLNTDTQQHAYVLRNDEKQAPAFLNKALAAANQLQDIFTGNFKVGETGNAVLSKSLTQAKDAGLTPTIYTHPLGYHGHAAGTTLGMWDKQEGVPGDGDYPLHTNTAYSIELNNAFFAEPWSKEIRIMLEEDAFFDKAGVQYLDGRQTSYLLIGDEAD